MKREHEIVIDEIARECEYLVKRHGGAGNEVLAAIVSEAFTDACDAWGIPSRERVGAFERAFPTLALY